MPRSTGSTSKERRWSGSSRRPSRATRRFRPAGRSWRTWCPKAPKSGGGWDLYLHALTVENAPWTLWLKSSGGDTRATFSPDSASIAYVSDTSGRPEIYLAPVAGGPEVRRAQISSNGGTDPRFSPDGRLIFFRTPGGEIVSVDLDLTGPSPRIGKEQRRFSVPAPLGGSDKNSFAIARDGKSLIVARPESSASYVVHVKTGWPR